MRPERLLALLAERPRLKIFVVAGGFCLCGYARDARPVEGGLLVGLGPSLRVSLPGLEWSHEPVVSPPLLLTPEHRVTRRLHTHRRQLDGSGVPDSYFDAAKAF